MHPPSSAPMLCARCCPRSRQRITQLQSLDDRRRSLLVEELGKKLVAPIDNIDHEHFHFIIANAPKTLPRDLAVGCDDLDIRIVPTLRARVYACMQILKPRVPETLESHELCEPLPHELVRR